jgi:phosphate-selective porin OprO/OprP
VAAALAAATWVTGVGAARAASDAERIETLERRVQELESERAAEPAKEETPQAAAPPAPAPAPPPPLPLLAGYQDGFFLKSADDLFKLQIKGIIQTDGRVFFDDGDLHLDDQFLIRRGRLDVLGTLFGWIDLRTYVDFASSPVELLDAYADARFRPDLRLRVGKTKTPFGIERLQSAQHLLFVERSLANNLVPNRDIGLGLYGDLFQKRLEYQVGFFNGIRDSGSSTGDTSDGKDFAARVFAYPLRAQGWRPVDGLGVGVAGTVGHQGDDDGLPQYRTPGQNTYFTYNATAQPDGLRWRLSPQAYWSWGPAGLLAEYVMTSQRVELVNGTANERLWNTAWQVALTYLITGENASYKGVVPESPFQPLRTRGPGAWELTGRVHQLSQDPDTFPAYASRATSAQDAFAFTVGVNWYWNRFVKVNLNYEQTAFEGGNGLNGNRETEKALLTRLAIAF